MVSYSTISPALWPVTPFHVIVSCVLTLLVRLAHKGWLRRRKSGNKYIYSPPAEKQEVLGGIVSRLVKTAFGGSAEGPVAALVNTHGITEEEAEHLQDIIAQAEKKRERK